LGEFSPSKDLSTLNGDRPILDWGILLLFGGGLTLSALLKETGTSIFLAESLIDLMQDAPLFLFLLAVASFVVMLTEVASNTTSSALLVPIFVAVAKAMGLSLPQWQR
jgi:sodium-dependent dicarboxylate transporter 2/3/5